MHCKVIFYLLDKANVLIQSAILGTMRFTHYVHITPPPLFNHFQKKLQTRESRNLFLWVMHWAPALQGLYPEVQKHRKK